MSPAVSLGKTAATEEGSRLYRIHCQACHGEEGKGDGPMKGQLELQIPDLTSITERYEGEFPTETIHEIIDGRRETPAHGTKEMPVWGFTFQAAGRDTDQEQEVHELISTLTKYLETLQTGPEKQE
jgi:mono/diheme cytochrome c family protein